MTEPISASPENENPRGTPRGSGAEPTNPTTELIVSNYFAAMIDVLGIREQLSRVVGPYLSEEQFKRGVESLRVATQRIRDLRNNAMEMCRVVRAAGAQVKEKIPSFGTPELQMHGYADTTVLYYSLGGTAKEKVPIMQGVPIGLGTVSLLMFNSLANRIPLRGAIEVEMGCCVSGPELFGRVVQSCYEIESKIAQTIRIVIGPVLMATIEQGKVLPEEQSHVYQAERFLASRAGQLVARDPTDGLFVLDYLAAARDIMQNETAFTETANRALAFLIEQEAYWTRCLRLDRATKYRAALNYFADYRERQPSTPHPTPAPAATDS